MTVVPPTGTPPLGPREGFLIIQVDTNAPIEQLTLKSGTVATGLPRGQHLWIVRGPAGRDGWRSIRLASDSGRRHRLSLVDLNRAMRRDEEWVWDDEFDFEIEAGTISYPGELIVRSRDSMTRIDIRNRNHSAMAVRRLLKSHPDLLNAHPIRHTGPGDDGFLDHYTRERDRVSSGSESEPR